LLGLVASVSLQSDPDCDLQHTQRHELVLQGFRQFYTGGLYPFSSVHFIDDVVALRDLLKVKVKREMFLALRSTTKFQPPEISRPSMV
jgi:hypothetical protein